MGIEQTRVLVSSLLSLPQIARKNEQMYNHFVCSAIVTIFPMRKIINSSKKQLLTSRDFDLIRNPRILAKPAFI